MSAHAIETSSIVSGRGAVCSCGWRADPRGEPLAAGEADDCRTHRAAQAIVRSRARLAAQQDLTRRRLAATVLIRDEARRIREEAHARRDEARRRHTAMVATGTVGRDDAVLLERARIFAGLSFDALWLAYFALGGGQGQDELHAMLTGRRGLPNIDHDVLAVVLNEHFDDCGLGRPIDGVFDRTGGW